MKPICVILCLLSFTSLSAQFAYIEDKDGYVNIRKEGNTHAEVIGILKKSDIFWCFETEGDWLPIDVNDRKKTDEVISGYIHNSRVRFIDDLPSVPQKNIDASKVLFENDSIKVEIRVSSFVAKEHVIQYFSNEGHKYISKIDNKTFWGTDGGIPKRNYEFISVSLNNIKHDLAKEAIVNLYEPNLNFTKVYLDINNNTIYISSLNSDGAGAYVVLWIITDGIYRNRITLTPF
jgi:hypothetical protein